MENRTLIADRVYHFLGSFISTGALASASPEREINFIEHGVPATCVGLAEEAHGGVPGPVAAVEQPAPVGVVSQ